MNHFKTNSIIAVANQKGGVGKTTTAVNLATAFAAIDKKVLLIDMDPQGNATGSFAHLSKPNDYTIYDLLHNAIDVNSCIIKTDIPNLLLIPSTPNLYAYESECGNIAAKEKILCEHFEELETVFEYIIIDCPPALGVLTLNALVLADAILIPLQCEYYALEGLSRLIESILRIKENYNSSLEILGIALTMHDKRSLLSQQIEQDARHYFGGKVFTTTIPRNVKISEAPSHGKPVLLYDYNCSGARAYISLAAEIIKRGIANEYAS